MKLVTIEKVIPMLMPVGIDPLILGISSREEVKVSTFDPKAENFFNNQSRLKYVTFASDTSEPFIVVFTDLQQHRDVARIITSTYNATPISAGFTNLKECYGDSFSLSLNSRPVEDTSILAKQLKDFVI